MVWTMKSSMELIKDLVCWKYSVPVFCAALALLLGVSAFYTTVTSTAVTQSIVAAMLVLLGILNVIVESRRGDEYLSEWERRKKHVKEFYATRMKDRKDLVN